MSYAARMHPSALATILALSSRGGGMLLSTGRLFTGATRDGRTEAVDPTTGAALTGSALPAFVLSTDGEATDGNIVRQHWDLGRLERGIMPILVNHGLDVAPLGLGYWRSPEVVDLADGHRGLIARADFDMGDPLAAAAARKSRDGYAPSVSMGWLPGGTVARGDLPKDDPAYREARTDECGTRTEGLVMGTEGDPNVAIEASMTPIPADPRAVGIERLARAGDQLARVARGEAVERLDRTAILVLLRDDPAVRRFLAAELDARVSSFFASEAGQAAIRAASTPAPRSFSDLFAKRSH